MEAKSIIVKVDQEVINAMKNSDFSDLKSQAICTEVFECTEVYLTSDELRNILESIESVTVIGVI